ncbi:MAG: hypothetical protein LEGION0398_MBIBDBAK_00930 [Legionellaceae bacterium]
MVINKKVQFRPHHFLCTFCFQGKGYSKLFISNYVNIKKLITEDNTVTIEVVNITDSICSPCPHRQGNHCQTEDKIQQLDQAHAKALGLTVGQKITWAAAKKLITDKLTLPIFHHICQSCEWKSKGICESVLSEYLETHE